MFCMIFSHRNRLSDFANHDLLILNLQICRIEEDICKIEELIPKIFKSVLLNSKNELGKSKNYLALLANLALGKSGKRLV